MKKILKIGTRGSQLALWQANWVKSAIERIYPTLAVELLVIKTKGDKILDVPLAKVGGKALFVKEIEEALLDGRIDLAVHSMKDMPAELPEGLRMGPIPERENPRDVLISKNGRCLADIGKGACIGTSSLRRSAQLLHARPDFCIIPLRGNLNTRLQKLDRELAHEKMEAIVLAAAGVKRLNLEHRITEYLDESIMLPAVGQGALCIELRENDSEVGAMMAPMEHGATRTAVVGERAFLNRLEGGCQVPIAGHGKLEGGEYILTGLVADLDGKTMFRESLAGPPEACEKIGIELAERLLAQGAKKILDNLKSQVA
jgi:hydroxymethylbilane synthase